MSDVRGAFVKGGRAAGWGGAVAVGLGALALWVGATSLWPSVAVWFGRTPGSAIDLDRERRLDQFVTMQAGMADRAVGRSIFWEPAAPPPPPPARVERASEPREEPPPAVYGGPELVAILGDVAWFEGDAVLMAGDEPEDSEDASLRVLRTDAPWGARVVWRGVEFDITLFERTTDDFLSGDAAEEDGAGVEVDDGSGDAASELPAEDEP